jgi:hypothetical protein
MVHSMAEIFLHSADGRVQAPVTVGRARMQRLAKHWHYVLRSRRRWIMDPNLRQTIEERAISHLGAIGIGEDQLAALSSGGLIEVRTDQSSGPGRWETRLLPWEYLLSVATRRFRSDDPFVVVRSFPSGADLSTRRGGKGLFVSSAPGALKGLYGFAIEKAVLDKHLGQTIQLESIDNPTLEEMRSKAVDLAPEIIHVSGVDNFEGTHFFDPDQKTTPVSTIRDGMFLRDVQWKPHMTDAQAIAGAVTAGAVKPAVASFNLYNSSARIAALAAAGGAGAALGFQDTVEDFLAEIFFANFYLYWARKGKNALKAFCQAMQSLAPHSAKMQGTGFVYWSSQPITPVDEEITAAPLPLDEAPDGDRKIREWVRADFEPRAKLNYSILHNERRPLFESFSIYRLEPRRLEDLEVEVKLQIGAEEFPYRQSITLTDHVADLADRIGVGLTSRLARSLQEAVRTTLFVRVGKGGEQICSETAQVSLLPVNEWRDDDVSRQWLPSFVLPRDPAVLAIIVAAHRYLMALQDDANAGYDGYPSLEADSEAGQRHVDDQVRSIWCALLYDFGLNYINPPPAFTVQSQRLRTPSKVIEGRRGTCIDLSLVIAACLEYIGINPVIFLLNGHAFPGYWTREESRDELLTVQPPLVETPDSPTPLPDEVEEAEETLAYEQRIPWVFDRSRYAEVVDCVRRGDIVPLESTLLTSRGGFWEAIEEGQHNLDDPEQFHSMLDIKLARDADVTPLPLAGFDGG